MAGNITNVTRSEAAELRAKATSLSISMPRAKLPTLDKMIEDAKEIEKYLWGGFAPIEKPPTPMTTISECIEAARAIIKEYVEHSQGIQVKYFDHALGSLERFDADIQTAFEKRYG